MNIIVGITGATGVIYGVRLIEKLNRLGVRIHLVMSEWAEKTLLIETDYDVDYLKGLVEFVYDNRDLAAPIASGSYLTDGMVILPCSMKTLSGIAHGYSETLVVRAADVALKEGRKMIICPREMPLSTIHLQNILTLSQAGARIMPPMPAFYNHPKTIDDIIEHHIIKVADQLGLQTDYKKRWGEQ